MSSSTTAVGRPRDPRIDDAILDATTALLADVGPSGLTVDDVARAAGCGKAAIYRRWGTKNDLIVSAVERFYRAPEVPDTGVLRDDLLTAARHYSGRDARASRVLANLLLETTRDPELRAVAYRSIGGPPVAVLTSVIERAAARGEIAEGAPIDLIIAIMPAIAFRNVVSAGRTLSEAEVLDLVDGILLPALTAGRPSLS